MEVSLLPCVTVPHHLPKYEYVHTSMHAPWTVVACLCAMDHGRNIHSAGQVDDEPTTALG